MVWHLLGSGVTEDSICVSVLALYTS